MKKAKYTINIESGIGGGSVSILENGKILDYFKCREKRGKADNLLEEIGCLLKKLGIKKTAIAEVKYSIFPGSHTGLKIGASIAKGLQLALNSEIEGRDLFECIYKIYSKNFAGHILVVLPLNRTDFVWRIYNSDGAVFDSGQLYSEMDKPLNLDTGLKDELKILLPLNLVNNIEQIYQKFGIESRDGLVELGDNLSAYLG